MKIIGMLIMALTMVLPMKAEKGTSELKVKSSIVCEMCKDKIEKGLVYTKGIKSVKVDVEGNEISVKYDENKISELEIKQAITKLGYVAGDMKPAKEDYDKLHGCCKAGGVCD